MTIITHLNSSTWHGVFFFPIMFYHTGKQIVTFAALTFPVLVAQRVCALSPTPDMSSLAIDGSALSHLLQQRHSYFVSKSW